MRLVPRYIQLLVLLEILILAAGWFIISKPGIDISFIDTALLSVSLAFIALVTLLIFFRGRRREPATQTMHSLVAVTLKFLLELVVALIWFFVAKKTGLSSVILFFVLYLAFTLFSIFIMLKTLKDKSL